MIPPTSQLPPIKIIGKYSLESLESAVSYLRLIYNPQVRGSRRRKPSRKEEDHKDVFSESEALETLRTDAFERGYAIKWLTALISQCGSESELAPENAEGDESIDTTPDNRRRKETLVEDAASLLATCAGTASAGIITRRFEFDLVPDVRSSSLSKSEAKSPTTICVDLTDVPLDNQDYGSVGAQTWGGACIMAEMMAEDPDAFCLPWSRPRPHRHDDREPTLRCLELGAGTGLVSLTAAKILERNQNAINPLTVEIVATDYYPSVLANLTQNVQSNMRTFSNKNIQIWTRRLDWSSFPTESTSDLVFEQGFDVVYGADIVYEAQHAHWIKSCLLKLLRKPSSSNPDSTFHLIIPLRATHSIESQTIEQVFPTYDVTQPQKENENELVIKHKEIIICDVESGKDGEEIEYAYYKIGWS